jgi:hypothetical protein
MKRLHEVIGKGPRRPPTQLLRELRGPCQLVCRLVVAPPPSNRAVSPPPEIPQPLQSKVSSSSFSSFRLRPPCWGASPSHERRRLSSSPLGEARRRRGLGSIARFLMPLIASQTLAAQGLPEKPWPCLRRTRTTTSSTGMAGRRYVLSPDPRSEGFINAFRYRLDEAGISGQDDPLFVSLARSTNHTPRRSRHRPALPSPHGPRGKKQRFRVTTASSYTSQLVVVIALHDHPRMRAHRDKDPLERARCHRAEPPFRV